MKKILFTLLIMFLALTVRAQEDVDFINDAIQDLDAPMYGVTGGPYGEGLLGVIGELYGESNGVVGAIGGTVSVGGLGAASYTIPIEMPTDIGEIKPNLSIVYNSQSSNGLLGWGWTIGGISAITRTGKNLFLDNKMKAVNFDDDRFSLDGQRLVCISGTYGTDGAEYRTETDGMSRIVSYTAGSIVNGPSGFRIWTANGLIMEYGLSDDSKMLVESQSFTGKSEVGLWLLNRVEDRNGNYMEYHYVMGECDYRLSYIKYTGNSNCQPAISPSHTVSFHYAERERPDGEITFIGNHTLLQNRLLESITINWWEDEIASYNFSYYDVDSQHGYQYYRLKDITYSSNGVSYNPTQILWHGNIFASNNKDMTGFVNEEKTTYTADLNGDGLTDIIAVHREVGSYFWGNFRYYAKVYYNEGTDGNTNRFAFKYKLDFEGLSPQLYFTDLDGDGRDDMISVQRERFNSSKDKLIIQPFLNCWISSISDWRLIRYLRNWDDEGKNINKNDDAYLMTGDFLGRGKNEIAIQIRKRGDCDPKFFYITYEERDNDEETWFCLKRIDDAVLPGSKFAAIDPNGDGIMEIMCSGDGDNDIYRLVSHGDEITSDRVYRCNELRDKEVIDYGDFNGDGQTDILSRVKVRNGPYKWFVNLSKNTELAWAFDITDDLPCASNTNNDYDNKLRVADMNGDGKSDLVIINSDKLYILYGPITRVSENGLEAKFTSCQTLTTTAFGSNISNDFPIVSGNFLGLECQSLLGREKIISQKPITDRYTVSVIDDGMHNYTYFYYDYLTSNSSIYSWSKSNDRIDSDIFSIQLPIKALKCTKTTNIFAGTPVLRTEYHYGNALIHKKGKGVLGFLETTSETYIEDIFQGKTVSQYDARPLEKHRALVLKRQVSYGANGKISTQTEFENAFMENNANPVVYVPVVPRRSSYSYNPDSGESDELLSKSISENTYQIDVAPDGSGCLGFYTTTLKTPDTYEGMSAYGWPSSVAQCTYQTHTYTHYQVEDQTMLDNWIVNRPDTTTVTAFKYGETTQSKSVMTYDYLNGNSYQPWIVTSYPGGDLTNTNGLATSTSYKYDVAGNVTSETLVALNGCQPPRVTSYTYDRFRFRETETNALDYVDTSSYDARYGEIKWSEDCNGQRTDFNHSDHLGSSEWVRYPDMTYGCTAMRWARNSQGFYDDDAPDRAAYYSWKRISGEAPVKVFYDAAGRELRSVSFGLDMRVIYQDTRYDIMGLVFQKSLPYFKDESPVWTVYQYDGLLRQTDTYTPDGNWLHVDYDGLTTTSTLTTYEGHVRTTSQKVNFLGQKVESVDADGTVVSYGYYSDGKLEWTQVGGDSRTRIRLEYDDAGNRTVVHDPNYGILSDKYDAFGQIEYTTTPKGNVTTYKYDELGRVTDRIETDNELHIDEITKWTYCNDGNKKGLLLNVSIGNKQSVSYKYDEQHLNRLMLKEEMVLGGNYQTSYTYDDAAGFPLRVKTVTYPTGYTTANVYEEETGILRGIEDRDGNMLWETKESNALGQVKTSVTGNGAVTEYGYSPVTARLQSIHSFTPQNILQDLSYEYDDFGNLAARYDKAKNLREEFRYDDLDRLDTILLNNVVTGVMTYDNLGRMTSKSADGQPVFRAAHYGYTGQDGQYRPHAINEAQVEGNPFCSTSQTIEYTMFDKVRTLIQGKNSIDYTYGYDHERIRMDMASSEGATVRKTYVGNCEYVEEYSSSSYIERTYLSGPMGVFAVYETNRPMRDGDDRESKSLYYIHKDHLGSWTVITDAHGEIYKEQSFDAWGNMRDPETWTGSTISGPMFDRGFTGHEHLFSFGLINMNGRMYDPVMSSFLSVDSYVQSPDNSQNFNRYAYCLNNPLKYTDPSGEELCLLAAVAIGAAVNVVMNGIQNVRAGENFFLGYGKAAAIGAVQGLFSFGIGTAAEAIGGSIANETLGKICQAGFQVVAHGSLDGVATYARGGNFWAGFASGAVSSAISSATVGICKAKINSKGWTAAITVAAGGLSGGITSTMAGGDFWDGLCNGFISSGLNHALHLVAEGVSLDDPPEEGKVHDAKNIFLKAYSHYQFGRGKPLTFDASTLDLDYISQDDLEFDSDGTAHVNLFEHSKTSQSALALGKISLTPVGDNQFTINPDQYDFNIEWEQGMTGRNVATAIAGYLHGPVIDNIPIPFFIGATPFFGPSASFGGSFWIHFENTVYIKPSRP